jgi:hypothetical protein
MKPALAFAALLLVAATFGARAAAGQPAPPLRGEVLEVREVEAYTYLRLKTPGGETWAAVPKAAVKKGAQVTIENPMVMENFESKTLNKKFDKVVFGSLAGPSAGAAAPLAAPGATADAARPAQPKVAKATGADARTVAEVVAGKATLKGKTVVVRGQVVKVNSGILGKNWVHLQDGSGSATAGTNDILVTTKDTAAVGDVVNAKGTVRTDVDVGSGYKYAVLIEDAALRK